MILEDSAAGFGWPITVTDPAGLSATLTGLSNDISSTIDPETGVAVTGRVASVAIAIASLTAAGLSVPRAIAERGSKPWRVRFNDVAGAPHEFKVREATPDFGLGIVTCTLEPYTP
jgi:hypothetical protein